MTLRNSTADGKRHGSTGAESSRSVDTVRGPFASFSTVKGLGKLHTKRQYVFVRFFVRSGDMRVAGVDGNRWKSVGDAGWGMSVSQEDGSDARLLWKDQGAGICAKR